MDTTIIEYNIGNVITPETESGNNFTPTTKYHVPDHDIISKLYPYPGLVQNNILRTHIMPCSFRKL